MFVVKITVTLKPAAIERRRARVAYLRCELARKGYTVVVVAGTHGGKFLVSRGNLIRHLDSLAELEAFALRALGRKP